MEDLGYLLDSTQIVFDIIEISKTRIIKKKFPVTVKPAQMTTSIRQPLV